MPVKQKKVKAVKKDKEAVISFRDTSVTRQKENVNDDDLFPFTQFQTKSNTQGNTRGRKGMATEEYRKNSQISIK